MQGRIFRSLLGFNFNFLYFFKVNFPNALQFAHPTQICYKTQRQPNKTLHIMDGDGYPYVLYV